MRRAWTRCSNWRTGYLTARSSSRCGAGSEKRSGAESIDLEEVTERKAEDPLYGESEQNRQQHRDREFADLADKAEIAAIPLQRIEEQRDDDCGQSREQQYPNKRHGRSTMRSPVPSRGMPLELPRPLKTSSARMRQAARAAPAQARCSTRDR